MQPFSCTVTMGHTWYSESPSAIVVGAHDRSMGYMLEEFCHPRCKSPLYWGSVEALSVGTG